jgi:hypothetical protein
MYVRLFFKTLKYTTYLFLALFLIGVLNQKPVLFMKFLFYVKLILACYLLLRFYFYTKFNDLDRKIVYSSALFILLTSFIEYVNYFLDRIRGEITFYTIPILKQLHL